MAEEIIIKVEGLDELKNIETSLKAFTVSINAAIQALSASGGSKSLASAIDKATVSTSKNSKAIDENKVKQQQLNAIEKERIISTSQYSTATEKLFAQIKILQREIDELVKSGQSETAQYRDKFAQLKRMTEEYVRLEKATGKAQMKTTGMYGATYQLSQVMRELPNFAIDARIGFLSLSNNLPMLLDSFKQMSMEIDEVTGKQKGFKGALKAFGSSIISLNTLFVVGTTLLTIYGTKIVDWISGITEADKVTKKYHETLTEISSDFGKGIENVNKFESALKLAKDGVISKDTALSVYNETLGSVFGNQDSLNKAELVFIKNKDNYLSVLKEMTYANALYGAAQQKMQDAIVKEMEAVKPASWMDNVSAMLKFTANTVTRGGLFKEAVSPVSIFQKASESINLKESAKSLLDNWQNTLEDLASKYPSFADLIFGINSKEKPTKSGASMKEVEFIDDAADKYFEQISKSYGRWVKPLTKENSEINKLFAKDLEIASKEAENSAKATNKYFENYAESVKNTKDLILAEAELSNKATLDLKLQYLDAEKRYEMSRVENTANSEEEMFAIKNFYAAKANELKREELETALMATGQAFGSIASIFEQTTEEYKIFATAEALMNTYLGITNALAQTKGGIVAQIAGSIASAATGFAAVKKIWEVDVNNPSVSDNSTETISMPALTPTKTAMTTNEENLNMMRVSSERQIETVVKVSEINKVQNNVRVRENNQNY